jgi:hypothetical protein
MYLAQPSSVFYNYLLMLVNMIFVQEDIFLEISTEDIDAEYRKFLLYSFLWVPGFRCLVSVFSAAAGSEYSV